MPSEPAHAWSSVPFTTTPLPLSYHRYNSPLPDIPLPSTRMELVCLYPPFKPIPQRLHRALTRIERICRRVSITCQTSWGKRAPSIIQWRGQCGYSEPSPCRMCFYLSFTCPYDAPTCCIFSFRICLDAQHAWGTRESTSTPFATRAGLVAAALCAECFMEALLDDSL